MLRAELQELWNHELDMPLLRKQIIDDVNYQVDMGDVTSWEQYQDILEPYDNHPYDLDGWHDAEVQLIDNEDGDDDGDDEGGGEDEDGGDGGGGGGCGGWCPC